MPQNIQVIYASTSGNTEHVVDTLAAYFREAEPGTEVRLIRAEQATPENLLEGEALILASGTWNTGGPEGQLNPHMHEFLFKRSAGADLGDRLVTLISLGDERYYFTTRCTEHFVRFLREHNGKHRPSPLIVLNEPYGQEEKIRAWGKKFLASFPTSV